MTKFLFYGDNQAGSRNDLLSAAAKEKAAGREIQTLDGLKISPKDLETALASASLFSQTSLVIENLGSRPLSGDKKKAIALVAEYSGEKNILLWEKKELTKTQVSAFGKGVIAKSSKTPAVIFTFLDSLKPGNTRGALTLLHETAKSAEEGFIFIMMSRHMADLLVAKSGDSSKLIPFKRSRLISQASAFPAGILKDIHTQLLEIDRAVKTGKTKLSYLDHLDLLLVSLLH